MHQFRDRGKHGEEPKGKDLMVTWPNEFLHHHSHIGALPTPMVDARAQTHYPAAMSQLATVIFRVRAETGHDAFLAQGRPQTWLPMN